MLATVVRILMQAVSASPSPAEAPPSVPYATRADYRQWPSAYDWYLATPNLVRGRGVGGRAVLRCKINDIGDLAGCKIVEETPKGLGFGKAAMALRTKTRMQPTPKGQTRWVLVPFAWPKTGPYVPPSL
jgi:TonB family protein